MSGAFDIRKEKQVKRSLRRITREVVKVEASGRKKVLRKRRVVAYQVRRQGDKTVKERVM